MNSLSNDSGGGEMTGKIVSPQEFKKHFDAVLSVNDVDLVKHWDCFKKTTAVWTKIIYPKIAKELGSLIHCPEYMQLDAVFFAKEDKCVKKPVRHYLYPQYFSVVMEHENDSNTSFEEMNKLSLINAPLKVLVTYPKQSAAPDQKEKNTLLRNYTKQVKNADVFGDFENKCRQMVIFGYYKKSGKKIRWVYYLYKGKKFDRM